MKGGKIIQEIDALISQLLEMNPEMPDRQFEAAIDLGGLNDEVNKDKIVNALFLSLRAPQALVRAHSAEALGKMADPRAINYLIEALGDPYYLVRSYSARALGELGGIFAIDNLILVMENDQFFGTRAEAAQSLGKICPKEKDNKSIYDKAQCALLRHKAKLANVSDQKNKRVLKELNDAIESVISLAAHADDVIGALNAISEEISKLEDTSQKYKLTEEVNKAQRASICIGNTINQFIERPRMGKLF